MRMKGNGQRATGSASGERSGDEEVKSVVARGELGAQISIGWNRAGCYCLFILQ